MSGVREELLPCPFCGGEAQRLDFGPGESENAGGSCISCRECQASGNVEFGYKQNFIANWNRRALATAMPEGGEAIGWLFQHDETWRISFCANDGVNNSENFAANNPRYSYLHPAYAPPPAKSAADDMRAVGGLLDKLRCLRVLLFQMRSQFTADLLGEAIDALSAPTAPALVSEPAADEGRYKSMFMAAIEQFAAVAIELGVVCEEGEELDPDLVIEAARALKAKRAVDPVPQIGWLQTELLHYIESHGGDFVYLGDGIKTSRTGRSGMNAQQIEKSLSRLVERRLVVKNADGFYGLPRFAIETWRERINRLAQAADGQPIESSQSASYYAAIKEARSHGYR